jgi:hypothetical protein
MTLFLLKSSASELGMLRGLLVQENDNVQELEHREPTVEQRVVLRSFLLFDDASYTSMHGLNTSS